MGRNDEDWAVFWCSLLSPVLLGEIPEAQRERYFPQLSQEERRLPNGQQRRISVRTFRRQWRRLMIHGLDGQFAQTFFKAFAAGFFPFDVQAIEFFFMVTGKALHRSMVIAQPGRRLRLMGQNQFLAAVEIGYHFKGVLKDFFNHDDLQPVDFALKPAGR